AKEAVHVVPARADRERAAGQPDREAAVVLRTAARPDHVACLDPDAAPDDLPLLVPVRRRRDAALLAEHARVVLARVERLAIEVAFHRALPLSSRRGCPPRGRSGDTRRAGPSRSSRAVARTGGGRLLSRSRRRSR